MSSDPRARDPLRSRPAPRRPPFTLSLLYFMGFYGIYALLFALPVLGPLAAHAIETGDWTPFGAHLRVLLTQATEGRAGTAALAALATLALAMWTGALPGLPRPGRAAAPRDALDD